MSDLKEYYRHAVATRVTEIEEALARLDSGDADGAVAVRRAAHSLRGSGGTYGFPEVTEAAAIVEDGDDASLALGAQRLLGVLRGITAQASPAAPTARLLIVDDDPEIVLLLRTVLTAPGREIVLAPSAAAAVQVLAGSTFDLVLLDLLLPDANGRSVLSALTQSPVRPRVIVLSGKSAGTSESDCLALGADAYIEKPFDPEAVARVVTQWLEQRT